MYHELLLSVILKHPLQLLSREEYPALDGTQGQLQPIGDFAVLESRYMHQERYAVVAWQAVHDAVNLLAVVVILGCVVLELPRLVYVEQIVGVVDKCLVAYLLAVVVYENIPHDGIYPPFEIGVGSILLHIAQSFQRGFLQQIVRLFLVCCQLICKTLQFRLYFQQFSPEFCSIHYIKFY